jgi:hypothetical protein
MYFSFLEKFIVASKTYEAREAKAIGRLRHIFFVLPELLIQEALQTFNPFPEELKTLYYEIGFGFMHRGKSGKFNQLFDPKTLIYTNNQVAYFATPETETALKYYDAEKQLLFFKTISNCYLAIDRHPVRGKNKIYYKGKTIEDSLYNFMKRLDFDRSYANKLIAIIDNEQDKEIKNSEKAIRKEEAKQHEKIKYIGGHRLLDKD